MSELTIGEVAIDGRQPVTRREPDDQFVMRGLHCASWNDEAAIRSACESDPHDARPRHGAAPEPSKLPA